MRRLAGILLIALSMTASAASAEPERYPPFVEAADCVSIIARHVESRFGTSEDGRTVAWKDTRPPRADSAAFPYEVRLCKRKRGPITMGDAWFLSSGGWVGPLNGRLSSFMSQRGLDRDCARFTFRSPIGGFMRIEDRYQSAPICGDANGSFAVEHQRVVDEGNRRDGRPIIVELRIFDARLESRSGPPE